MKVAPNLSKLPVQTTTMTTKKDAHKMKLCKDWITTFAYRKRKYSKLKDAIAAVKTMKEDREQLN